MLHLFIRHRAADFGPDMPNHVVFLDELSSAVAANEWFVRRVVDFQVLLQVENFVEFAIALRALKHLVQALRLLIQLLELGVALHAHSAAQLQALCCSLLLLLQGLSDVAGPNLAGL